MKRSLLTGFRALAFSVGAFALLAVTGTIEIRQSLDVAMFVIGLTVFWVVIESLFLNMKKKTTKPPGT